MVGVDSWHRLAWSEGQWLIGAVLHSSDKPGELSQWLCDDDSTIHWHLYYYYLSIHASQKKAWVLQCKTCLQCRRTFHTSYVNNARKWPLAGDLQGSKKTFEDY